MKNAVAIALLLLLVSCEQLFVTSLAQALKRDLTNTPVTHAQAADLAETAVANNDPVIANLVLATLIESAEGITDPVALAELQDTIVQTAITASGIATVMNYAIETILPQVNSETPPTTEEIMTSIDTILEEINVTESVLDAFTLMTTMENPNADQQVFAGITVLIAETDGDLANLFSLDPEAENVVLASTLLVTGIQNLGEDSPLLGIIGSVLPIGPLGTP